jgi:hypothetical protein
MPINGFEDETSPLNQDEIKWLAVVGHVLKNRVGEKNAITADEIATGLVKHFRPLYPKIKVGGARIRKIINHIRINRMITDLVATSKGYYREPDPKKLLLYVTSLRQRAEAINAVADSYNLVHRNV